MSWKEFKKGKTKKKDVQDFSKNLRDNLFALHEELKSKTYNHSNYFSFYIKDPKLRHIHKATVKDRILHHAVFRILYPIFDRSFIFDSYSCRLGKGTHRAVNRLDKFSRKVSKNNSKNCFVLKCDIKKYFDSVNQGILTSLIAEKITDKDSLWLIEKIIRSYPAGLPLGNITSQLFANIYLNELDKFIKHKLKIKYYIRYCDDFLVLDRNERYLEKLIPEINNFLVDRLCLKLHENKIIIRKFRQGIDFLGYICFPYHRTLRIKTRKRIFNKLGQKAISVQTMQSYLGVLSHCNSHKLKINFLNVFIRTFFC